MKTLPPVLLTMPDYCGTLAAARCLGANGIPVWMAGSSEAAPAMHSRHVQRKLHSPPYTSGAAWLEWLRSVGEAHPGLVLYPTSDDLAWFIALHLDELKARFRTWMPKVEVYERLLDKSLLHDACVKVGLETPLTMAPVGDEAIDRAAAQMPLPVLIKQRTQVLSLTNDKGVLVKDRAQLAPAFRAFRKKHRHGPEALARMPHASEPMMQRYYAEGVSGSLQVTGFIDETGELFVLRAANKVLQRPKTLGISLCLEACPVPEGLGEKLRALCLETGYFGVFGVEFLMVDGRPLLIDFNPRYYHFMALDLARGMPLPLMTAFAATGQREKLAAVVREAQREPATAATAFTYGIQLYELLAAQTLTGRMPLHESRSWLEWRQRHAGKLVDAVNDPDDRRPWLVDLAGTAALTARHPLRFLKRIAFDH